MKKYSLLWLDIAENPQLFRIFKIMRFTLLLLFSFCFCALAEQTSSQNARVNIKRSHAKLDELINDIERQSDYLFIYNNDINSDRRQTVNAKNKATSEVLKDYFSGTDIEFEMEGNHIILSREGQLKYRSSPESAKKDFRKSY